MSSAAFDYNLKEIENSVKKSDLNFPWHNIVGTLFNPKDLPPPVLLRPIVEDIISKGDIDILYPEEWLADYLAFIETVCTTNSLHFLMRSYDRRGVTLKIYDIEANSWIQIDIHIKLYQFGVPRIYFSWRDFFPRAQFINGALEPDALDGAILYLLHLKAQKKNLDSPAVVKRWAICRDRLHQLADHNHQLTSLALSVFEDPSRFDDYNVFKNIRNFSREYYKLLQDSRLDDLIPKVFRKTQKFFGRNFFKSKKLFFVGADGAGKTSLMRALSPSTTIISNAKTHRGFIFYRIAKKIAKKRNYGTQASDIFPKFFFITSLIRTYFQFIIRPKKLVFFDRSPNDILITMRKSDRISLHKSAKYLTKFSSGLLTIHVLSQDHDKFENKKNEMTETQIKTYNSLMFRLIAGQTPINYIHFLNIPSIKKSSGILKKILNDMGLKIDDV